MKEKEGPWRAPNITNSTITSASGAYKTHPQPEPEFYVFNIHERPVFDLLISRLQERGYLQRGDVFEILSSKKLTKPQIKVMLRSWHRNRLITLFRDEVRLGFYAPLLKGDFLSARYPGVNQARANDV